MEPAVSLSARWGVLRSIHERVRNALHAGGSLADFSDHGGVRGLLRNALEDPARGDGFWIRPAAGDRPVLSNDGSARPETCQAQYPRDHRGRPGNHGGGEPWRGGGEGSFRGLEYRAPLRA